MLIHAFKLLNTIYNTSQEVLTPLSVPVPTNHGGHKLIPHPRHGSPLRTPLGWARRMPRCCFVPRTSPCTHWPTRWWESCWGPPCPGGMADLLPLSLALPHHLRSPLHKQIFMLLSYCCCVKNLFAICWLLFDLADGCFSSLAQLDRFRCCPHSPHLNPPSWHLLSYCISCCYPGCFVKRGSMQALSTACTVVYIWKIVYLNLSIPLKYLSSSTVQ